MDSGLGGAAGSKDAGATDAPVGVDGAPPDGCGTALLCDNFDSYTAPGAPGGMWRVDVSAGGMASVDTTRAFSGTKAVHVTVPGTASYERAFIGVRGAPLFPLSKNVIFGRMMIYVTRAPTTTAHWTFVQGQGTVVPGIPNATDAVYRFGAQINGTRFLAQYDTVPSSDCAQRSMQMVPQNRWACVEWRFDGELKELDFWLDSKIDPALSVRQRANNTGSCQVSSFPGIWEPPIFNSLSVGWQHYQTSPGEMWIDDFAFDTKGRVGCPAPPP